MKGVAMPKFVTIGYGDEAGYHRAMRAVPLESPPE